METRFVVENQRFVKLCAGAARFYGLPIIQESKTLV